MSGDLPQDLERLGRALGDVRAAQVPLDRGRALLAERWRDERGGRSAPAVAKPIHGMWRVWMAAGVAALGIAGIGIRLWSRRPADRAHRYVTRAGERATVTLADGSRITLAPQTVLVVAKDFGRTHRTVSLLGEGYFTVTQTTQAPFIVQTGRVRTRVLGTTFDVFHDQRTHGVRVAVITGRVSVGTHVGTVLDAGTIAVATDSTLTVHPNADVSTYAEWPMGRLRFRDATVHDVLATLGRWYGVEFRLQDSTVARDRVTATFDYPTRADALLAVQTLLNVTMTFQGDVITLHPRSTQRVVPPLRREMQEGLKHPTEIGR